MRGYIMKILFSIIMVVFSTVGNAGEWSSEVNINYIQVDDTWDTTGVIHIDTTTSEVNPNNECTYAVSYALKFNRVGFEQMYSLLLSVMASGKKIQFYVSGCSADGSRPLVKQLRHYP